MSGLCRNATRTRTKAERVAIAMGFLVAVQWGLFLLIQGGRSSVGEWSAETTNNASFIGHRIFPVFRMGECPICGISNTKLVWDMDQHRYTLVQFRR